MEASAQSGLKRDPLLFTFHRSSSEDPLKLRKNQLSNNPSEMVPKIFKNVKMRRSIPKLPPMSMMMGKE